MSTERLTIDRTGKQDKPLYITGFYGGKNKGRMIQLSQQSKYIQLTEQNAIDVVIDLLKWLNHE